MSQHWYEVKSNQGIVQVMLGWDPPFAVVSYVH